jgi:hypothetical protein
MQWWEKRGKGYLNDAALNAKFYTKEGDGEVEG